MSTAHRHYNPDWLSDDDLIANFVARQDEFVFLRDELARAPLVGSVQHYLLVGPRGAGKTTLLKRLAVAIRRDEDIKDHLIALSFPEELYQVKNLADFWWASCDALVDELDRLGRTEQAEHLIAHIEKARIASATADPLSDAGLRVLQQACAEIERRPVLLVDNLDLVFQRIDKSGRKLKDPHAPAYWALREALSTTTSPIAIGGSVRLSEPFTDYDKAFYDFFLPKRLSRLELEEVQGVLERLADVQGVPEVKEHLRTRPSRIEALHELTGGNPRALGLIFELLRQSPNGRAVEDFERLMDLTTPYYKARFEDLSEQAQVVMHALAVRRPGDGSGLRFGHTAAEIGGHAGLPTGTVSAQMDILEREGLVEKTAAHGRTQYRIAEQLFRLWLQMRSNRRIRQNVIGLTEFLEAMYDLDELQAGMHEKCGASALAEAQLSFAVADSRHAAPWRHGLEAHGADRLLEHLRDCGGNIDDYLPASDLPEDLAQIIHMREQLQKCNGGGLTVEEQDALLGSIELRLEQKQSSVQALCKRSTAPEEATRLRQLFEAERRRLLCQGFHENDLPLLFNRRARGYLPLPKLTPQDAENTTLRIADRNSLRAMIWHLLGIKDYVKFDNEKTAEDWVNWGKKYASNVDSAAWTNVAAAMRRSKCFIAAQDALDHAFVLGATARTWFERGVLLVEAKGDPNEAEAAFRKTIEIDPTSARSWVNLGSLLENRLCHLDDAEAAYRKALELDPNDAILWIFLGKLNMFKLDNPAEAEIAYRKAIDLDPTNSVPHILFGMLLSERLDRPEEAASEYRQAIECDPSDDRLWVLLGHVLEEKLYRNEEAKTAFRKAVELNQRSASAWGSLGNVLATIAGHSEEAEGAYRRAIELSPAEGVHWYNLGNILAEALHRPDDAEIAYRKAIELDPQNAGAWNNLGNVLADSKKSPQEAEIAYRKAIEISPDDPAHWYNLGNLLAKDISRLEEAENVYGEAIKLDPTDAAHWIVLGDLLAEKLDRPTEAEAAFRKVLELDPSNANHWNRLGALLAEILNRSDEAEAAFRKAIELDPADAAAWNNLGNMLDDLDEAEAAYQKATELYPDDPISWNNLGILLEQQDRLDEASAAFGRGAELESEPNNYWQTKRANLLARRFKAAAEEALDSNNLPALRDNLAQLLTAADNTPLLLVCEAFVEGFLASALTSGYGSTVLGLLRQLEFEKHARPLLLAFEAAAEKRPDKLADLEPEVRNAARHMLERLTGKMGSRKRSSKRTITK